jgi:hypothetical protein
MHSCSRGRSLVEGEPLIVGRPPTWLRYYIVVFGFVWFAILSVFLVTALANSIWGLLAVALVLAGYGGFILWRTFHLGLVAYTDEIVVRNMFKTRRIPRLSVDGFRIGSPGIPMSIGRTIVILVPDDTAVSVDGLMWAGRGKRGRARLERLLAQLRDWRGMP